MEPVPGDTVGVVSKIPKKEIVSRDPDVVSGALVFAGTRVPAKKLVDYLKAGHDPDEFFDDFPCVSREQDEGFLELALEAVEDLRPAACSWMRTFLVNWRGSSAPM